jgi:hypothetical protein
MFGTREFLQNNYLYRMAAALLGIYGNSKAEAVYPIYSADAGGQPLDGASRYALRFAPGGLPPVNAFWSLTMYELPESLLVANPLDRYLVPDAAPAPFMMAMRLYWPKDEALTGQWTARPLQQTQ